MSYKTFYLQAKDAAAKIRSGEFKQEQVQKAATVDPNVLIARRPGKDVAPYDPKKAEEDTFQDMILMYMQSGKMGADADTSFKGGEAGVGFKPVDGPLSAAREAIAAVESRGSGDYAAVGPVVEKGSYKGQRAYGRYQVMEGNIGPWTKEVFGKAMTKEEFMADPAIQDAVVEHQLSKSVKKYGTYEDAASVWFSGRPVSKAGNSSDGYTTVPQYVTKFQTHFKKYAGNENIDVGSKQSPRIVPRPKGKTNV